MSAYIIDGRKLARKREGFLRPKVAKFIRKNQRRPRLAGIKLAGDQASQTYLKLKKAAAERAKIEMKILKRLDLATLQSPTLKDVDGIFVQHPPGISNQEWFKIVDQIPPQKDVDCLTTTNLQLIKAGQPRFLPATVKAIGYCLLAAFDTSDTADTLDPSSLGVYLKNKRVAVLGRSPIIGQPLAWWLKSLGAKVEVGHSKTPTQELKKLTSRAEILVSAVGQPGLVTAQMVKPDAVVIDVGAPRGDVRFDEVALQAAAITPVPGGVGPLTVISLMENLILSC